jgi:hypothetical protein
MVVSLIRLVRDAAKTSLAEARERVDEFIRGKPMAIEFAQREDAQEFVEEVRTLGAQCRLDTGT